MSLLFTGSGRAGSWIIRGEQIGAALGATVAPGATLADFKRADVTVCVKRVPDERLTALRAAGRPWIWDVLDCYPQPICSAWNQSEAVQWAKARLAYLQPDGVIWPNQKMAEDVGFNGPQTVIYHHHRPDIRRNPIRESVRVIGYEGAAPYVDAWRAHIESECDKRGWRFVINPPHLADVDIVLALRGGNWNGYVPTHWKSNVKLANAHGSGTPFLGSPEEGYRETQTGAEYWARNPGELRMALDWLTPVRGREEIARRFLANAYGIEQAAKDYRAFLCGPKFY